MSNPVQVILLSQNSTNFLTPPKNKLFAKTENRINEKERIIVGDSWKKEGRKREGEGDKDKKERRKKMKKNDDPIKSQTKTWRDVVF